MRCVGPARPLQAKLCFLPKQGAILLGQVVARYECKKSFTDASESDFGTSKTEGKRVKYAPRLDRKHFLAKLLKLVLSGLSA